MWLNKYGYYIVNMTHTGIMLNKHIDPTFLHIYQKQPTAIVTLHPIANCVLKPNMPLKCHMYATYTN